MSCEDFEILGLQIGVEISEVKKAYRALAKLNHPDRFKDEDDKKRQVVIMQRINQAYREILIHIDDPTDTENDYELFRKGLDYFYLYTGSHSLKGERVLDFEPESLLNKKKMLENANKYFRKVVNDFPESDWAGDSGDRILKIDKLINNIDSRLSEIKNNKRFTTQNETSYAGIEKDTAIYKKGMEYFNECYEGKLIKMEKYNLKEKMNYLMKAKLYFKQLLREYPDSDWAYDSSVKISRIDKMIDQTKNMSGNNYKWTAKGTPLSGR